MQPYGYIISSLSLFYVIYPTIENNLMAKVKHALKRYRQIFKLCSPNDDIYIIVN